MKRFDPQQVHFCPDVDAPHCVEVTIPLMIDLIRRRGREKPEHTSSPVLMVIPREGTAILTMNPGFKMAAWAPVAPASPDSRTEASMN